MPCFNIMPASFDQDIIICLSSFCSGFFLTKRLLLLQLSREIFRPHLKTAVNRSCLLHIMMIAIANREARRSVGLLKRDFTAEGLSKFDNAIFRM